MNDVGTMTRITGPGHGHPVASDVRLVLGIVFLPKQALRLKKIHSGEDANALATSNNDRMSNDYGHGRRVMVDDE